jgi:hypothetical protein
MQDAAEYVPPGPDEFSVDTIGSEVALAASHSTAVMNLIGGR